MNKDSFAAFSSETLRRVQELPDAVGLVFLGSAADTARADDWSDHDLWLIVDENAERYRTDLSWLAQADQIALAVRETEHGLKVVYTHGHVVELAVATMADVATFAATQYAVALDRGGVADLMARIQVTPAPLSGDAQRDLSLMISLLLIGVGRERRGERVAAGSHVREYAVRHLLRALILMAGLEGDRHLDPLDLVRRVEQVLPHEAAQIAQAQAQPVEECARPLLGVAEAAARRLRPAAWSAPAAEAVGLRLGWER